MKTRGNFGFPTRYIQTGENPPVNTPTVVKLSKVREAFGIWVFLFVFLLTLVFSLLITAALLYVSIFGSGYSSWICRALSISYALWYVYSIRLPFEGHIFSRWFSNSPMLRTWPPSMRAYCSLRLIFDKDAEIRLKRDPRPRIYSFHPHGLYGFSMAMACSLENTVLGRRVYTVTLNLQFYMPIYRDIIMASGFIPSDKTTIESVLNQGCDVAVALGGAREAILWEPNVTSVVVRDRKGIFEIAQKSNAVIVPCLAFGETELYKKIEASKWKSLMNWIYTKTNVYPTLFFGRFFSVIPRRVPITVVFGEPILLSEKGSEKDRIIEYRDKYIEAVEDLHETWKHLSPGKPSTLKIY